MYPLWQIIGVSIFPGLLWLWFFYRQDEYEPEPRHLLILFFLLGMLAVLPAILLERPWRPLLLEGLRFGDSLRLAFLSFVIVGGIEEACKTAVLFLVIRRLSEFDEPVDGIIYGVTIGLGFAALENLFYAMGHSLAIGLFRAAVTPLAHASFSGWAGYYVSKARFSSRPIMLVRGYLVALALHGIYDFLLLYSTGLTGFMAFALIGVALTLLLRKIRELELWSPFKPTGPS